MNRWTKKKIIWASFQSMFKSNPEKVILWLAELSGYFHPVSRVKWV
jgi:hypothetical protein